MKKHVIVGLLAGMLSVAVAGPALVAQVASIAAQPPAAKKVPHKPRFMGAL